MNDFITLIANISLALTFLAGLIFGIAQVKAATRERRERLTIETLRVFQTREFAEFVNFFRTDRFPRKNGDLDRLSPPEQVMYIQFSQQMESLGILVAEDILDINLVDKTLGDFVTVAWKRYEPGFSASRKNDPYLGEYFQWLAERMDEQSKENPREPFYKNKNK
jgi:hypothetical protein